MKVQITDQRYLSSLPALDMAGYLRAKGWQQQRVRPRISSTWTKVINDAKNYEVLLPLDRTIDGYPRLMYELLRTLEAAEERDQPAIVADLRNGTADVVRVQSGKTDTADGTMSLGDGSDYVLHIRELVLAGACSAVRPRAHYTRRRPAEATEYLKRVRLGQSEIGSYTVTVHSRVPPAPPLLQQNGHPQLPFEDPFERRAMITLANAMSAAKGAAEGFAAGGGNFDVFQGVVDEGVSANLCDALAGIQESGGGDRDVAISMSWSWRRPAPAALPNRFVFSPDEVAVLREAGQLLREIEPRDGFELIGTVIKMDRAEDGLTGTATVRAYIDRAQRQVAVRLNEEDYAGAADAHINRSLVSCVGELVKRGRIYELDNPRDFRVIVE